MRTTTRQWLSWPVRLIAFLGWFAGSVIKHNLMVISDGVTPGQRSTPGIAKFVTHCRNDHEITALSAFITLTPGTLALGHEIEAEQPHRHTIYVHAMYARSPDALRDELRVMERHVLHAIRKSGEIT